jgi:formylmethanofuran dehydrogenase subunit D
MQKKVVTIGSSAGVTISPAELRSLGVSIGDSVEVTTRAGVLEVKASNPHKGKTMSELLQFINDRRTRP